MRREMTTGKAQLALDTILRKPTKGIPSWMLHVMQHEYLERIAGAQPGDYKKQPESVYLAFQHAIGTCLLDQYIPDNPLTMGTHGYEGAEKGATTGAGRVILDGLLIDSAEAVVEHMERFQFARLREAIASFNEDEYVSQIIAGEAAIQKKLGPDILKSGYGFADLPRLRYSEYGYVPYLTAYGLYPEVIERDFMLQADLALLKNQAAARAYKEGRLPPLYRLDHDMAGSKGPLVSIASLDKLWFPQLARCLEPLLKTEVNLIWHCDGNLMEMVPRLLEIGIRGFQGFQYEDGMDYERICAMKAKDGQELIIIGGVSVTCTLPMGTPRDVKRELEWLVAKGPKTGLFLGASSSITPGVPWENLLTLIEGLQYYRVRGRS